MGVGVVTAESELHILKGSRLQLLFSSVRRIIGNNLSGEGQERKRGEKLEAVTVRNDRGFGRDRTSDTERMDLVHVAEFKSMGFAHGLKVEERKERKEGTFH